MRRCAAKETFYEASCSPTMYAQVDCGKDSCHVLPESEQPPLLGCKMKVEDRKGSPEILQIKIEDVNSSGLEEEQSDQPNDFFVKVEVKTEHDIDAHPYLPEPNDSETSFFKNHPHEGESTESTMETAPTFLNCTDTCPQDSPSETNERTFYKQDKPNEEMFAQNNFHKTLKRKKGEHQYKCTNCGKSFSYSNVLKRHMRNHNGERPFKCTNCGKSFKQSSQLKKHMTIHNEERPFKCTICGKYFNWSSSFKKHMMIHNGECPHTCTTCRKSFNCSSTLKNHMRIHNEERPYACTACRKSFKQSSSLKRHMRIHNGERPYKCTSCGKSFKQSSSLKRHMIIHNEERPYACTTCGKSFNRLSYIPSHMRIHNGERPFKCTICGTYLNLSSSLKRHMRLHNGYPDIVLKHKEEKSVLLIERSVSNGFGLNAAETRKMIKYQDLKNEVKTIWKLKKAEIVPVIVRTTGMIKEILSDQSTNITGKIATNEL
uniref:zinc finger protein 626-like n=1 Tax=Myxine glutinosa TaxID=7769 RepID=UPI00358ED759